MKALKRSMLAFVCLLSAAVFVGCGSRDNNKNDNVSNEQTAEPTETTKPETDRPMATDRADDGGNIGEDIVDTVDDVGTGIVDGVTDVGEDIVDGVDGNDTNRVNDATNGTTSPAPTQTP